MLTWKELKEKLEGLTEEQLAKPVLYYDDCLDEPMEIRELNLEFTQEGIEETEDEEDGFEPESDELKIVLIGEE